MLILQIILTIIAWRNGWKWKSLLPVGILFCVAFLIGYFVGVSGGDLSQIGSIYILDIISVIILLVMVIFHPKEKLEKEQSD